MNTKNVEKTREVERLLCDLNLKDTAEAMAVFMHRTNQQSFTRLCIEWLRVCADKNYRYDMRNEASHVVAMELLDGHDDLPGLPYV